MACQVDEFGFTCFENMAYKSELYSESILTSFQRFRQNSEFCDVELICKDTVVKAHRVVLAAACVYFKALFNAGLEECQKGSVSLPTIQPEVLQLIVEFIYTGKVNITSSTVQHLISAADMLQLGELAMGCAEYLKMHLHPSNALGIFRFAEAHNCIELANAALDYAQAHWVDVAKGEELLETPSSLFIRLLSSDKLGIESETEVLQSALRWLEHEPETRKKHCIEVLRRVRLRLVGPHAFEDALNGVRDPYIMGILDAFRTVLHITICGRVYVLHYHKKEINLLWWNHAVVNPAAASKGRAELVQHHTLTEHRCEEPPSPRMRARHMLLVVGGVRDIPDENRVELATALKFDMHKRVWEQIASMNSPRYSLGVATTGGLLYAVGGNNGYGVLASGEVYNPSVSRMYYVTEKVNRLTSGIEVTAAM
ncbi:Actin-binding protein IPP [Eumeta japonica]|uniref:Actin-binding protein IPP n=1 Tax=Eumeta variegata TaxID=151549 RepID=A0A4C1Y8T8_EUMVA|nr:Actin-binding protein IPP [Eumeta japonica]